MGRTTAKFIYKYEDIQRARKVSLTCLQLCAYRTRGSAVRGDNQSKIMLFWTKTMGLKLCNSHFSWQAQRWLLFFCPFFDLTLSACECKGHTDHTWRALFHMRHNWFISGAIHANYQWFSAACGAISNFPAVQVQVKGTCTIIGKSSVQLKRIEKTRTGRDI